SSASGEEAAMIRMIRGGGPAAACLVLAVFRGPTQAADGPVVRRVQATAPHDMQGHAMPAAPDLPRALPEPMAASAAPRSPAPAAVDPVATLSLGDLERLAVGRNPTLRQAFAQIDASQSRSFQAGLYPNPRIGYQS